MRGDTEGGGKRVKGGGYSPKNTTVVRQEGLELSGEGRGQGVYGVCVRVEVLGVEEHQTHICDALHNSPGRKQKKQQRTGTTTRTGTGAKQKRDANVRK